MEGQFLGSLTSIPGSLGVSSIGETRAISLSEILKRPMGAACTNRVQSKRAGMF